MAKRSNQTRTAQRVAGVLDGPVSATESARHLDARERARHEQRSFGDLQAVEAIGDPFAPEQAEIEAEIDAMIRSMR